MLSENRGTHVANLETMGYFKWYKKAKRGLTFRIITYYTLVAAASVGGSILSSGAVTTGGPNTSLIMQSTGELLQSTGDMLYQNATQLLFLPSSSNKRVDDKNNDGFFKLKLKKWNNKMMNNLWEFYYDTSPKKYGNDELIPKIK